MSKAEIEAISTYRHEPSFHDSRNQGFDVPVCSGQAEKGSFTLFVLITSWDAKETYIGLFAFTGNWLCLPCSMLEKDRSIYSMW